MQRSAGSLRVDPPPGRSALRACKRSGVQLWQRARRNSGSDAAAGLLLAVSEPFLTPPRTVSHASSSASATPQPVSESQLLPTCPFCKGIEVGSVVASTEGALVMEDAYPVSAGHVLIVSRRHVGRLSDLTGEELQELWEMVATARAWNERSHGPDGYNIGVNDGAAAGQTVPHVHLHVIPRYSGDCRDPRGGVRWVIPERAAYWEPEDV